MFYVLDDENNKVEAYDKEGFLAFLEDAIANHTLEGIASDSAFVDKLKCCVGGGTFKVAFVTQATYNTLQANGQLINNCYYFVTDDTSYDDLDQQLSNLTEEINGETNSRVAADNLLLPKASIDKTGYTAHESTDGTLTLTQGTYRLKVKLHNSGYTYECGIFDFNGELVCLSAVYNNQFFVSVKADGEVVINGTIGSDGYTIYYKKVA